MLPLISFLALGSSIVLDMASDRRSRLQNLTPSRYVGGWWIDVETREEGERWALQDYNAHLGSSILIEEIKPAPSSSAPYYTTRNDDFDAPIPVIVMPTPKERLLNWTEHGDDVADDFGQFLVPQWRVRLIKELTLEGQVFSRGSILWFPPGQYETIPE